MNVKERVVDFEHNIFDIIRMLAIISVTVGHCMGHLQVDMQGVVWRIFSFPGIVVLFSLSGFLVTASYDRLMDQAGGKKKYIKKRFVRIFPGLWCSIFVSTICIYIFYDKRPDLVQAVIYLVTQFFGCNFYTGSWLREYGVGAPNGSLWTIMLELQFYIIIMLGWKWLRRQRLHIDVLLYLVFVLFNLLSGYLGQLYPENIICKLYNCSVLPYLYMFMTGVILYKYREKMFEVLSGGGISLVILVVLIAGMDVLPKVFQGLGGYTNIFTGSLLSFLTIVFAFVTRLKIRFKFDISYGMYLYHMIIVNIFVQINWMYEAKYFWMAIVGSVVCGFLSWYMVESKFLHRKKYR